MTTADLIAAGGSSRKIGAQVERGDLVRIGHGYYATADLTERMLGLTFGEHFLRAYAVVGALGLGTVASHRTAAHIHGLDLLTEPGTTVTVTRPAEHHSHSAKPGVHLYVARLPVGHVFERFALPITTVARTVVDLARTAPFREGVVVADCALHQHLTSKDELRGVLAECPQTRGCRQAAAVVEFADGLAESPLESIARVVFRDCKLPPPSLQVRIMGTEFIGRVDFLSKQYRTIVEVDGVIKYTDPYRARTQLRRDQRLRQAGYEVVPLRVARHRCRAGGGGGIDPGGLPGGQSAPVVRVGRLSRRSTDDVCADQAPRLAIAASEHDGRAFIAAQAEPPVD